MWLQHGKREVFPNLYTVLVGHPGIGKGGALSPMIDVLRESGSVNLISGRVTIQRVLEKLAQGFGSAKVTPQGLTLQSDATCCIAAPEMNVFLEASDMSLYSSMNDLWDCSDTPIEYGTRSKGSVMIHKPCPTLIGGITPGQLAEVIPSASIYGGFTRRCNFVYADKGGVKKPFPDKNTKVNQVFVDELRHISTLSGEYRFSKRAAMVYESYYLMDNTNEFDDELTQNYNTTRWVHATKVAMCLSASRSDILEISEADMLQAITLIDECGSNLQKVFRAVGDSELVMATDKVLRFIESKPACTRSEVMSHLWRDIGSTQVLDVIMATLEAGQMVVAKSIGSQSVYKAVPLAQRQQQQKNMRQQRQTIP